MSLNLIGSKDMTLKALKNENRIIFVLCHNFWTDYAPQIDLLNLNFVKYFYVVIYQLQILFHKFQFSKSKLCKKMA